jgi:hypothetical protein
MNPPEIIATHASIIPIITPIDPPGSDLPIDVNYWMVGYKPLLGTGDVRGVEVALDTAVDVEDDVDDSEGLVIVCIVDIGERVVYAVVVLDVIVALTLVG